MFLMILISACQPEIKQPEVLTGNHDLSATVPAAEQIPTKNNNPATDYVVDLKIDMNTYMMTGSQTVRYMNTSDHALTQMVFNVPANAFDYNPKTVPYFTTEKSAVFSANVPDYGFLKITDVLSNNEKIDFSLLGTVLSVQLKEPLEPQETISLTLQLNGYVPAIHHRFGHNKKGLWVSHFLPTVAVLKEGVFYETPYYPVGSPFYTDIANYDVTITTDSNYTVFGTGQHTVSTLENQTITNMNEKLVRDFSFAIFDNNYVTATTLKGESENVDISFYTFSDLTEEKAKQVTQLLEVTAQTLDYFEKNIGTYPYKQLNLFEIEYFNGEGFSNAESIFIDTNALQNPATTAFIEKSVAAQWFGNIVKSNPIQEAWLNEGMSNFFRVYLSQGATQLDAWMEKEYASVAPIINAIEQNGLENNIGNYASAVDYETIQVKRATLMVYSLYKKLGEPLFMTFAKEYYLNYSYQQVTATDFIRTAESIYGKELNDFFAQWCAGKTLPALQ